MLGADRSTPVKTVFTIMIEIISDYCDIKTPDIKSIKCFAQFTVHLFNCTTTEISFPNENSQRQRSHNITRLNQCSHYRLGA